MTSDGLFLLVALFTYGRIALVASARKRTFNVTRKNKNALIIPLIIVASFSLSFRYARFYNDI